MKYLTAVLWMFAAAASAQAAEKTLESVQVETGLPEIERGATVLMDTCHGCHTLKYIKYRDLVTLGISKEKVDAMRGDQAMDGPITSQMSDEAGLQSFGKVPPDLSLMVKARDGEANYLYSYLVGYYNKPDGTTSNHVFPETKMPDPLGISGEKDPAKRVAIQAQAHDVVSFLAWASDPHERERIRLGYYVIGYLLLITVLMYFVKRNTWSRLK
jgi:ubiquinol-cytochrome c reductase cytochrome c1 subunit